LGGLDIACRIGLHTGECEIREGRLHGIALHIAARVAAMASPRAVFVSQTVKDLVAGSDPPLQTLDYTRSKACPANGNFTRLSTDSSAGRRRCCRTSDWVKVKTPAGRAIDEERAKWNE
jgi:class 3 adenylate cyclase